MMMRIPDKLRKLTFSLIVSANKGLLALITLLDVALGGMLDLVRFSQLYALGSTLTPFVGGGASTLILRNGYRSSNAAMALLRGLQKRIALIVPLAALFWFWHDDLASAVIFACAIVLTDSAINLMRSHQESIRASILGGLRLIVLTALAFIGHALGADGMELWWAFSWTALSIAIGLVIYAHIAWPKFAKVEKEVSHGRLELFLIVMFALNVTNANLDRLIGPEVFTQEFSDIYVPMRNISVLLLVIYPVIINYAIDALMDRKIDAGTIAKAIIWPAPAILLVVGAIAYGVGWRLDAHPAALLPAILACWALVTILGGFSLLSSWLLGHTVGAALVVAPAMLLLCQGALLGVAAVTGSAYPFAAGMAGLACLFVAASPIICRTWSNRLIASSSAQAAGQEEK